MKSVEVQLNEALATIETLKTENGQLKEAVTAGKVAAAKAEREGQLKESKLPEPCTKRINEAFAKSTDNAGLKEAINTEVEYIKSLRTLPKHNGAEDNSGTLQESEQKIEDLQKRQFIAYVAGGMNESDASAMSGFKPKK